MLPGTSNTQVGGAGTGAGLVQDTVGGNLAAGPSISSLTDLVNNLNRTAQTAANNNRIPGAAGLEAQSSKNIGSELGGQLPADVVNQLTQQAAERGIGIGSPGSDNSNSALLRSLGLNSLQLQGIGQRDLSAAFGRNPAAPLFDPSSQFLTPGQKGALDTANNRLALDWWQALNPQHGQPTGHGGGGGPVSGGESALPSWFPTVGGTPSPQAPPSGSSSFLPSPSMYPGTSVPGLPPLGILLGQQDPGYGYSPDPYGQQPFGGDASSPDYWDFGADPGANADSTYNPFSQYGG
jgi:hypothetical protein